MAERCYKQYARMAEELRMLRQLQDLTRKELAAKVGSTEWMIKAAENCYNRPKNSLLNDLARFFGKPEGHFQNLIDKEADIQVSAQTKAKSLVFVSKEQVLTAMQFLDQFSQLDDDAKERIAGTVADVLANPANIKGCESGSGRNE